LHDKRGFWEAVIYSGIHSEFGGLNKDLPEVAFFLARLLFLPSCFPGRWRAPKTPGFFGFQDFLKRW